MYIDATKGSSLAFLVFITIAFFVPGGGLSEDIQLILTISTFLFAIIVGFFLSRFNKRYDRMRELISGEDALFLSLLEISDFFGEKFYKGLVEIVDKYYIIAFDFELGEYYKHNAKYIHEMYKEMEGIRKLPNKNASQLFDDMVGILVKIEHGRNESSVLSLERMKAGQWMILIILAAIILFSIFFLKVPELYSQIVSVLLSTVLVLLLLVLRDLQNFRLGGKELIVESGQEVIEAMGKLRYYNIAHLKKGTVDIPNTVKEYRVGHHKPGDKQDIRIHKNDR